MTIEVDLTNPPAVAEAINEKAATVIELGSGAADVAADAINRGVAAASDAAEPVAESTRGWIRSHPLLSIVIAATAATITTTIVVRSRRSKAAQAEQ